MRGARPAYYVIDPDPLEAAFVEFGQPGIQQLADRLAPLSAATQNSTGSAGCSGGGGS